MKKLITLEEIKTIADSHNFTIDINGKNSINLKTDIEVAKNRYLYINFSWDSESFNLYKDVYSVVAYLTDDIEQNGWSKSKNEIYFDSNHKIKLKYVDWFDDVDFDTYYNDIKQQVQKEINAYLLRQKKNAILNKKYEIVNEETLIKFRNLAQKNKDVKFNEQLNKSSDKTHTYVVDYNHSNKKASFTILERPKLKKWDIKSQLFYHRGIRVDTFEDAYAVIEWWINSPKFEWICF